jgi:hypothetical protein
MKSGVEGRCKAAHPEFFGKSRVAQLIDGAVAVDVLQKELIILGDVLVQAEPKRRSLVRRDIDRVGQRLGDLREYVGGMPGQPQKAASAVGPVLSESKVADVGADRPAVQLFEVIEYETRKAQKERNRSEDELH